jgi:hypothetical protein
MEVLHRGLYVSVPHPFLHPADVRLGDHPGAAGVPQVVEAQSAEAGSLKSVLIAFAARVAVERDAQLTREDELDGA